MTAGFRSEKDFLGELKIPSDAYYGIQTMRAKEIKIIGFQISSFPKLIKAMAAIKKAAAIANLELGLISEEISDAISLACDDIMDGKLLDYFIVDLVQGGAGTSTNMNINEVIANRALEILGHSKGQYNIVHPIDHVNLSQSTNDVFPTAIKIASIYYVKELSSAIIELVTALRAKSVEFKEIIKVGRTQLRDAVPITLGQEFGAYATTLSEDIDRLNTVCNLLQEINLGGTAIGTGINADPKYPQLVCNQLAKITCLKLTLSEDLIEATQDTGVFVMLSGVLKRTATKLSKICNDLRLLSSGPRAGLNEINLPPIQAGSSTMPGKINPVVPEIVSEVCYQVIGNDLVVTLASEAGQLELNPFLPVIAFSIFESMKMLRNTMTILARKCIAGISANSNHCFAQVKRSLGLATFLTPYIGYDQASKLAAEALAKDTTVYDLVIDKGILPKKTVDELLSPSRLTKPSHLSSNSRVCNIKQGDKRKCEIE